MKKYVVKSALFATKAIALFVLPHETLRAAVAAVRYVKTCVDWTEKNVSRFDMARMFVKRFREEFLTTQYSYIEFYNVRIPYSWREKMTSRD